MGAPSASIMGKSFLYLWSSFCLLGEIREMLSINRVGLTDLMDVSFPNVRVEAQTPSIIFGNGTLCEVIRVTFGGKSKAFVAFIVGFVTP